MAQSLWVARLNLYRPIPSDPSDWFDADEIAQARAYNRPLQRIAFTYAFVAFAAMTAFIAAHAGPRLIRAVGVTAWPLQLLIVVAAMSLVLSIVSAPFETLKARYQRRWEMVTPSRIPAAKRVATYLRDLVLSPVFLAIILLPTWFLIRTTQYWWILAAAVMYGTFLAMLVLLPSVVTPFDGKVTPIDDDDLRRRVRRVAREAGVEVSDVYQSDESKRTPQQGGYISFGRTRRVVLFDNLLARPRAEIDVFLARKISNLRHRSNVTRALALFAMIVTQFAIIRAVVAWAPLLHFAGVATVRDPGAVPLVAVIFAASFIAVELISAWVGRSQSRRANLDSLEFTRDADAYMALIRGLHARNREELAPSWWRRVRSAQPTPAELLALGAWWRARRRVTVLFTDIEDSTSLLDRLGDNGWYEVRRDHNEIIRACVAAHEGIEVDSAGDGFLIVFEDAGEALLCAMESQPLLDTYNHEHPGIDLRVRMGLHAGDVIRKGREVIGREVHVAARVASCASGGEILVSASVRDALQGTDRFAFEDGRSVELKGFTGAYTVWRVPWAVAREPVG